MLLFVIGIAIFDPSIAQSQSIYRVVINMGILETIEVSPDNIFNYQIANNENKSQKVKINGTLVYKNSGLRLSYNYTANLQPGLNYFSSDVVSDPNWEFSSNAFKELFLMYKKLPQGTYEYCVTVTPDDHNSEQQFQDAVDACVYYTVNDIFLIDLVTPEDDAEIYEYNPLLSWVVNYPFASELTYKIRLTEQQKGQNKEQTVTRNNPIYTERGLLGTGIVYPVTAKPLEKFQPYVWTVDAYYKGLLLGGAEAWRFTIIEDSVFKAVDVNASYIDIRRERGAIPTTVVGKVKLKYFLSEKRKDLLQIALHQENGKSVKLKDSSWAIKYGDNRTIIDLKNIARLKHGKQYEMEFINADGMRYAVAFTYLNPDLIEAPNTNK